MVPAVPVVVVVLVVRPMSMVRIVGRRILIFV